MPARTTGWLDCVAVPMTEEHRTPSGAWKIEYLRCERNYSYETFWTTYRYTYRVTFVSGDGRSVQFTALDGRTRAEIISGAEWHESMGLATVTRPRKLARPKRRKIDL